MKLSEIVKTCSEIIHCDLDDECFAAPYSQICSNNVIKTLVNGCNFVLEELYRDYATALGRTVVEVVDGFCDTGCYKLSRVISLLDGEGNNVKFRYGDGGLYVERDGKYNLCYARLPGEVGWDDDVRMPSPRVTERILIYGVIREYYATQGDWYNAKQWDGRFKDALRVADVKSSTMTMPVGRWV